MRLVQRMEKIHFRPWNKGIIGKELKVPFPVVKKKLVSKVTSLNDTSRRAENVRISAENVKMYKYLTKTKSFLSIKNDNNHYLAH